MSSLHSRPEPSSQERNQSSPLPALDAASGVARRVSPVQTVDRNWLRDLQQRSSPASSSYVIIDAAESFASLETNVGRARLATALLTSLKGFDPALLEKIVRECPAGEIRDHLLPDAYHYLAAIGEPRRGYILLEESGLPYTTAKLALLANDHEFAEDVLTRYLRRFPKREDLWAKLVTVTYERGNWRAAFEAAVNGDHFNAAVRIARQHGDTALAEQYAPLAPFVPIHGFAANVGGYAKAEWKRRREVLDTFIAAAETRYSERAQTLWPDIVADIELRIPKPLQDYLLGILALRRGDNAIGFELLARAHSSRSLSGLLIDERTNNLALLLEAANEATGRKSEQERDKGQSARPQNDLSKVFSRSDEPFSRFVRLVDQPIECDKLLANWFDYAGAYQTFYSSIMDVSDETRDARDNQMINKIQHLSLRRNVPPNAFRDLERAAVWAASRQKWEAARRVAEFCGAFGLAHIAAERANDYRRTAVYKEIIAHLDPALLRGSATRFANLVTDSF